MGVAEKFLDDDEVDALFEEQGGGGVPEVVEADHAAGGAGRNRGGVQVPGDDGVRGEGLYARDEQGGQVVGAGFGDQFVEKPVADALHVAVGARECPAQLFQTDSVTTSGRGLYGVRRELLRNAEAWSGTYV